MSHQKDIKRPSSYGTTILGNPQIWKSLGPWIWISALADVSDHPRTPGVQHPHGRNGAAAELRNGPSVRHA
jgi:hypothetical protein